MHLIGLFKVTGHLGEKLTVADIKNYGEYTATVKLFTDISATFTVVVTA